jgi:hypothetical protein
MRSRPTLEKNLADTKALQIQVSIDYEQKLRRENSFTCTKGCSYCCHHPFLITIFEGLLLYQYLTSHGQWTASLRKKLNEHRNKTSELDFGIWALSNIPCPLLEVHLCIAYDVRPLHCRVTYSQSNASVCHPHALGTWTKLVPSSDIIINYNVTLQKMLRRLELPSSVMPVSMALLTSEIMESK